LQKTSFEKKSGHVFGRDLISPDLMDSFGYLRLPPIKQRQVGWSPSTQSGTTGGSAFMGNSANGGSWRLPMVSTEIKGSKDW